MRGWCSAITEGFAGKKVAILSQYEQSTKRSCVRKQKCVTRTQSIRLSNLENNEKLTRERKRVIHGQRTAVTDLGGFRGFKPPPPPLGLPKKKKKLIEKRHHNMSRPTQYVPIALCLRLSLRQ